jgi:hypothetical protein
MSRHQSRRRHQQELLISSLARGGGGGGTVCGGSGSVRGFHEVTDEMMLRIRGAASSLDRLYVVHLVDRMDKILNRYKCSKERRGEGRWVYYKRIPSRYWHEMLEAYDVFREVLGGDGRGDGIIGSDVGGESRFGKRHIWFCADDKMKMELYVRLLPALGHFDKCRGSGNKDGFGVCRRIVYDHFPCLVD